MAGISLSGIRYIYEARLEARAVLVQEGFAILGIAVGVALLFASQISSTSLTRSVAQLDSQLVGSAQLQLTARGPEGFGERLLGEVRRLPGVQDAMPIADSQVNLVGPGGERSVDLIGVDPHTVRASGPLLRRFSAKQLSAQQAIALPAPLAGEIGAGPLVAVRLQIGARFAETLVGATLQEGDIGELVHNPIAMAPLGYAQRLTGMSGRLTRIFVRFDPARAGEVHAALAQLARAWHVNLVSGQFEARLFAVAVAPESKSEELFSGISALVGFMFALNAMLITVPARRKLIEDVRPHGATRWMTVEILLFDAAVIGVLACILGLVLGDILSIAVFRSTPGYLASAFPVGNNRIVTWQSVALAVAAGMTAAIVGVLWPVRQILARPLQPPSDSADHRRTWTAARLIIGLLCLILTTVILVADTQAAVVGNIALVIALVCLLPFMFDGLVGAFKHVSNLLDGVGSALAVTELQTPQTRVRSLAIAATAAVAVFGVVEFQGTQANLERGLASSIRSTDSSADVWVIPSGRSSIQPTTPFKAVDAATLARLPGVGRLGVYRGSFLNWGDRRLWILAPSSDIGHPVPVGQLISGNPILASERVREGGWAVLSQALAEEHHLRVGQAFTLPSPRPLTLRVAALTTNLGWPPGAIVLSSSGYARAWANSDPSAYQIQTAAGASATAVRTLVRRALASEPGLAVETATEREQRHYAVAAQGLSRLTQIRLLVLIAAMLAVVGAMGAMIWQRRDLIAFIKCHGYEEGVLWRWLLCEAAVLLMAGCSIGAIFGLYAQLLGSHFLATVTGFPIVFSIEGLAAISSFGLVCVIALAVVALPGYLVVRVPPNTTSPAY
ncbi:MAG: FtsX-like permease family protein [Solirubrobacteraceae bacterium]